MHVLPPAVAFALGLALAAEGRTRPVPDIAGDGPPPEPPPEAGMHGPVLIAFDGAGAVDEVLEAAGVAEAIDAIEHKAAAAGPLLVLLVPVVGGGR